MVSSIDIRINQLLNKECRPITKQLHMDTVIPSKHLYNDVYMFKHTGHEKHTIKSLPLQIRHLASIVE